MVVTKRHKLWFYFGISLQINKLVNLFVCWKLDFFIFHLSLALVCVQNYLEGSDDSMLCTLYKNTNPTWCMYLGEFLSWLFRTLGCFIIKSFCIFWFSDPLVGCFFCRSILHLISIGILQFDIIWQSLGPQYSLISSHYSSLDRCIWFHSNFEKCTRCGGTHIILTF